MDISTLQMLALMACGLAVIVCITFATTSKSRLLKAGGYAFTTVVIAAVAAAVFHAPTEDADAALARNIAGLILLAAAGWAGFSATRAYRGR
ncbi:hypothetical protein [Reyranella sp.]|uniref:hypothetical protein n=1 Tax=Reyranella sp. TaxID=1929291 RepID=UPI002730D67C|nr:hypothetical protein [Reyranella sp.]MDP2377115.1 hypothetical protein [Reyranella sp.]